MPVDATGPNPASKAGSSDHRSLPITFETGNLGERGRFSTRSIRAGAARWPLAYLAALQTRDPWGRTGQHLFRGLPQDFKRWCPHRRPSTRFV